MCIIIKKNPKYNILISLSLSPSPSSSPPPILTMKPCKVLVHCKTNGHRLPLCFTFLCFPPCKLKSQLPSFSRKLIPIAESRPSFDENFTDCMLRS